MDSTAINTAILFFLISLYIILLKFSVSFDDDFILRTGDTGKINSAKRPFIFVPSLKGV